MVWLIGFGATLRDILRVKISKKLLGQQKKKRRNPVFLRVLIVLMVAQNPIIHSIF